MIKPLLRNLTRRVRNTLDLTSPVLEAMFMSRGGSKWERVIAYGAAAGSIIDLAMPDMGPHDHLLESGYRLLDTRLGRFYCNTLRESGLKRREEKWSGSGPNIVTWAEGKIAAIYSSTDEFRLGPYLLDSEDVLTDILRQVVWQDHEALALHPNPTPTLVREEKDPDYLLVPMKDVAEYYGEPGVDWYVDRIRHHGDDHRTILLWGPTGVGKSTLGRQIARGLDVGGRVLKVASASMNLSGSIDVIDLVKRLQPTVLMLDDIDMSEGPFGRMEANPRDLALYEELHDHVPLTILTKMDDRGKDDNPYAGMRPGRLDEIFRLKYPSPRLREQILLHYIGYANRDLLLEAQPISEGDWEEILEKTDRMTGAFLAELARRFCVHGFESYKQEVASVRSQIPKTDYRTRRSPTRNSKVKAMPNKTERARIAKDIREALDSLKDQKWMVKEEPWGVFIQRMDSKGGKPNDYGGYGDPMMVMGYGWHHGKKKGGPYRGQGKYRRMLLTNNIGKHLSGGLLTFEKG